MPPLKVKPIVRENKGVDLRGPSKTVGTKKFKIYSEQNRDSVAPNPSRTSLLSRKETSLANSTCLEDLACSTMETKTKTKIARKALADVSNIRGNASRLTKPGGSRNSALFGTVTYTASSSRPLAGTKASLSRAVTVSRTSLKASNNKAMRNGSHVHDTVANVARGAARGNNAITRFVGFMVRGAARGNNAITRKSLPVLKRESHLGGSRLQGDGKSAENVTRKLGLPLKTRVGGHLVSQLSNSNRVPKDRKSDGLILRGAARGNNAITRKSLPVLKRESHLGGSRLQGDGKSAENVTRKLSFPLKTRVGGHLVSQLSNPNRVPKDRKSDGLILRGAARGNNAITRKSLPVLKRESHLGGSRLQGDGKSAENVTRKLSFPLKTRVGGHLVSQLSNPNRVPKDRKSDGLILRGAARGNNAITRKSLPVLKRESHLGGSRLQGDGKSAENVTRKRGFPLKTRVGGHLVSQLSNPNRVPKDRKSDGLILRAPRYQTSKDVLQRSGRSMKLPVRTALQNSNAQKNCNSKCISKSDKSLGKTLRSATVASCSVAETSSVGSQEVLEGRFESINDVKPHISEITANKRSIRRESYTSLLISRSKLVGNKTEVVEQKLPDIDDHGNPLEVAEYVDDIYQYYWIMDAESASLENYLMAQTDVTPQMRGILVNWLIEVHLKLDLMPETLYLTIALLDRYLSLVPIKKKDFQLVGLVSLLLASKYEDFWHPRVKDLISITAESYSRKQFLEMEKDFLKRLKFRMNMPTPYVFMLRFLKASQSEIQVEHLAFYLIELSLVEYGALKFRHSILCASAVYVARCTLNKLPKWTLLLGKHAQYEESQIRECAQMILKFHKAASKSVLKVTYDKYTRPEFSGVATFKPLNSL